MDIEDTIDRLHGLASSIEHAGAKHRKERVQAYRQKEGPKWVYENFKKLAAMRANDVFKNATATIKERIAESIAWRRIRFEYLKEHQKKRLIIDPGSQERPLSQQQRQVVKVLGPSAATQEAPSKAIAPVQHPIQDDRTMYSATEVTKLDFQAQQKQQERAESVASTVLRNGGFPAPPQTTGSSFQCPYCRLQFSAREAQRDRWR
jgi:hypothetical protein